MSLLPARVSNKPQYVFHPTRALRRALHRAPAAVGEQHRVVARLPWGLPLELSPTDAIGFSILAGGVFDPCVTETLHRLIDPGDRVIDIGANIGYLTSLAAARAGAGGSVLAFEPHPVVFELLAGNAARWRCSDRGLAPVALHQDALSDRSGAGELEVGPLFHVNMGLAALRADGSHQHAAAGTVTVPLRRLEDMVQDTGIGLVKIDVEGHEAAVLRGAGKLLALGRIRDLVFEDHEPYPSEATEIVEAAGYTLYGLDNDLFGVRLGAPSERGETAGWPGPSYLATRAPGRAAARLKPRGWQVRGIGPALPRWR